MFSTADTIVAIATPPGHGGVGIVRLSGPASLAIAARLIERTRPFEPRRATLGVVRSSGAAGPVRVIDRVIVTWFQGPASYTGEDVIEIGAHGSPVVLAQIVERAIGEGARLAEPGEFTFRAYLHERLDLVQAEAVADLTDAVTPLQARAAADQLEGTLTRTIGVIDAGLFDLCARLEASLDFPDEGYHFASAETTRVELDTLWQQLDDLVRDGRRGRLIREGATVVIAGRTNVGKSSLFNALVGAERAIVTHQPGTTRDAITERIDLNGFPITLVDTAGLRETDDAVEVEGVRRARTVAAVAQLVLVVVDGSVPFDEADQPAIQASMGRQLVVINKIDLPEAKAAAPGLPRDAVRISVRSGAGLDDLRARIIAALTGDEFRRDTPALSNVRHLVLVERAREAVARARAALTDGATEELLLAELAAAREALESVVGRRSADDLLEHIFGRFCIGK